MVQFLDVSRGQVFCQLPLVFPQKHLPCATVSSLDHPRSQLGVRDIRGNLKLFRVNPQLRSLAPADKPVKTRLQTLLALSVTT